jgi:hypothetical protein
MPEDGPFYGKTVVFTGTLSCGLTRVEAAQYVVNAGGRVTNSMSKKVDFLILGQQDSYKVSGWCPLGQDAQGWSATSVRGRQSRRSPRTRSCGCSRRDRFDLTRPSRSFAALDAYARF